MKAITGSFYFKKTFNGNLIGEFANNDPSSMVITENANIQNSIFGFIGTYISTWYDNASHQAQLEIKAIGNKSTFSLIWTENGKITYEGEAFLQDENILVGFYQTKN